MNPLEKEELARRHQAVTDDAYMDPGMVPQTQQEQVNLNEVFLDNSFLIDELMNTFQGNIVDSINKKVRQLEPLIPEKAAAWLVTRIVPYTSKIFSLSKLDEAKIREMVYEFATNLSSDMMYCEQYGIHTKDRDYIYTLTIQMMEATVRRAIEGITMIRMLSQHQVKEITSRAEGYAGGGRSSGGVMSKLGLKV